MKISPVIGTPTIPNPAPTGLAPEKLARLKAIAAGTPPPTEEEEDKENPKAVAQPTIKMNTNRTVLRDPVIEATPEPAPEVETAIPDADVQANAVREATQPLSPQFAALAKQRRALQVKERELAEKEKVLGSSNRAELEARIKAQPLSVLQELGVTYDQLTNDILASQGGVNPEIQSLKAEIKALKEGVDKTLSDKDVAQEQAVIREISRNVTQLAQGDDWEFIRETQSQPDVVELIRRTYKESGELLDELEAMKLVEEHLVNEYHKLAKLKKVQSKLTAPPAPLQQQPQTGMRTLTNKDSAKPVIDRRQRAMLAFTGQLKR